MATVVQLPRLSDTMEEGVIAKWRIQVGDKVKRGQVIAEIETDKATMEFESFDAGTVLRLVAPEGETLPVGAPIAVLGQPGEKVDEAAAPGEAGPPAAETGKAEPASEATAGTPGKAPAAGDREGGEAAAQAHAAGAAEAKVEAAPAPARKDRSEATGPAAPREAGRVPASPLARRLAREHDLDLGAIPGSGPHGRVVKADVEHAAAAAAKAPAKPAAAAAGEADADGRPFVSRPNTTHRLSQMRKTIVKRMGQSKREAPHIYLTVPIVMDRAMAVRAEVNLAVDGTKVSVNDLIVLACARALRRHPKVNSNYTEGGIVEHGDVHVGIAVALDDGLVVPVVRFADQKSLTAISRETRDLGTRAKSKELRPEEMSGSTFTISNLGMLGVEQFAAVINPGESAILAVGATHDEAVVEDGQVVVRKVMRVTLCSDHRAFDGADSAKFLQTLKKLLEGPMAMFA
jgi:pyruvate dehydrogenase E2 component (dihydrolipoamide acetyltransferase)